MSVRLRGSGFERKFKVRLLTSSFRVFFSATAYFHSQLSFTLSSVPRNLDKNIEADQEKLHCGVQAYLRASMWCWEERIGTGNVKILSGRKEDEAAHPEEGHGLIRQLSYVR